MAEEGFGVVGLQGIISPLGVNITDSVVGCVGSGGYKIIPAFTDRGARGRCGGGRGVDDPGCWGVSGCCIARTFLTGG